MKGRRCVLESRHPKVHVPDRVLRIDLRDQDLDRPLAGRDLYLQAALRALLYAARSADAQLGSTRWSATRVELQTGSSPVWFPAPGGGHIVLAVMPPLPGRDEQARPRPRLLEGTLSDDTFEIRGEFF